MKKIGLFVVLLLMAASSIASVDSVELKGLFGQKAALFLVDGQQAVLKIGASKYGVTLLEVTATEAVVKYNGQQYTLGLSKQIGGSYKAPSVNEVRIAGQEGGHYWVQGSINGYGTNFVVDTGASNISMNLATAQRMGLDYKNGTPVRASTANGVAEARKIVLRKVTVGSITRYNIDATIMLDNGLPVILLGNSFLGGVDMRTENGVLILKERF